MLCRGMFLSLFALLAAGLMALAAEPTAENTGVEVERVIAALEESFNHADAKALAECWTPSGEFIGPHGERIVGRDKIQVAFHEFFAANKNVKLRLTVESLRQLADNVVLVDLLSEMTPIPEGLQSEPASAALLVRRDGCWQIDSMREVHRSVPAPHLHLKCLEWMVGDWVEADSGHSGISGRSSCHWTANGSYLIRKFSIEKGNRVVLAGTEVIGWDPRAGRIRSWVFDRGGSFGESVWTRDGQRWVLRYTGTLADGKDVSATHVLCPVDADSYNMESLDRFVGGERHPDLAKVTFKRQAVEVQQQPHKPVNKVLP